MKKVEGGDDGGTAPGADPCLSAAAFHPLQEPQHLLRGGVVQALVGTSAQGGTGSIVRAMLCQRVVGHWLLAEGAV